MKEIVAFLLSVALAVSSVGTVPALAAETNTQNAEKDATETVGEQEELIESENEEGSADGDLSGTEYRTDSTSTSDENNNETEEEKDAVETEVLEEVNSEETSNRKYDLSNLGTVWFGSYYQQKIVDENELDIIQKNAVFKDGFADVSGVRVARKGGSYNYQYFKEAPIEWIIIGEDEYTYTLMSKKILEIREFANNIADMDKDFWHDSTLRSWLNSSFYETAFTEEEQNRIWETYVTNEVQTYDDLSNHRDGSTIITNDKVYLLYSEEVDTDSADSLIAYTTPYANTAETAADWWLRGKSTWHYGNIQNSCVSSKGALKQNYPTYSKGVRPVIQVTKNAEELSFEEPETEIIAENLFDYVEPSSIQGKEFLFRSELYDSDSIKYTFDYDDNWVFSDSEQDRYNLMKTSIRVAMAAFGSKENMGYGPINITNMMDSMGFIYTDDSVEYPSPSKQNENTIGSAIGLKNLKMPNGSTKSIILVAIRGGGYGAEWGGNFHVGLLEDDIASKGFLLAADQVGERLSSFINENKEYISDDLRIWITGYSRAAATSNLLAASLINGKREIEGVSSEEVLAFCFECPLTTADTLAYDMLYDNIINIVNPIDFVPKVPLNKWLFRRYGKTYNIPSAETVRRYETRYRPLMRDQYSKIFKYNGFEINRDAFMEVRGQASTLDNYTDLIGTIVSRNRYYTLYESEAVDYVGSKLGKQGDPDFLNSIVFLAKMFNMSILRPVTTLGVIALFKNGTPSSGKNAHFPELCMSWIDALSGFDMFLWKEECLYRSVLTNCPVDVTIQDSEGNIVGHIVNNEVEEIEDGIVARIDENEQKVFILPKDEEYTIDIKATDSGEVNYTIQEYNFDSHTTEKVINYKNIEVTSGDELQGTVTEVPEEKEAEYTLQYKEEETPITPDEVLTGDEVVYYSVELSVAGEGTVTGGGSYVTGEFAKITATPDEGAVFTGWFEDDTLVSSETEYRFAVTEDKVLSARFEGGTLPTGWFKDETGWKYIKEDGSLATGWLLDGGTWYYMNSDGIMQTGWQKINGIWYYMNGSGAMVTGWQKLGSVWYYMNGSGAMVTGWQKIGTIWYYFNGSGAMVTGWQSIGGKWYYFNGSGAMVTGWQKIGSVWYYFNGSGAMVTGWQKIGSNWYYFSSSGAMQTGWQKIGGKWYYFKSSGAMVTGRQQINGKWYTFSSSGAMQ